MLHQVPLYRQHHELPLHPGSHKPPHGHQLADLELTISVTLLPAEQNISVTCENKVPGEIPQGGEDPGNGYVGPVQLFEHPETLPPLIMEEELVDFGKSSREVVTAAEI